MLNYTYADINGLNILSGDIYCTISGLFDAEQSIITNELFTPGSSYNRSKVKEKKITINFYIKNNVISNLMLLRQYLLNSGLKTLTVGISGLPTLTINIDILNWVTSSIGSHVFTCQFEAPDPFLYSQVAQSVSLGSVSNASLSYPITYPITYGALTGGQGVITNQGNVTAYPVITVVGTCSNISITNQTTGESMSVNVSLGVSDTLIIDNRPSTRGVYLNGINRMDLKSGSWISSIPGANTFSFQRNSLEVKQHCTIALQSRWV